MSVDRFAEVLKWAFLGAFLIVPFAIGYATARAQGTGGWIVFAMVAVALTLFAWLGDGLRNATSSQRIDAYWHFLPILLLIGGRVAGSYSG